MPRPPGIPNKNKQALIALLQAKYPGYHPVMEMAAIANNDVKCTACEDDEKPEDDCPVCFGTGYEIITLEMRFNANKEVAGYITPKLKAVEHSGSIDTIQYKPIIKRFDGSMDKDSESDA